jgi:hypothetical protein
MQNCVLRDLSETTMRTRVRPGGATSVRGGPTDTADVAGDVRALLGVGPSVDGRVVAVAAAGVSGGRVVAVAFLAGGGSAVVAAAAATSSAVRSHIMSLLL